MSLIGASVMLVVAAGCGTTDEASRQTLPPLVTTTSTTVPPTTSPEEAVRRFYQIQPGDSLAAVAASFQVPVSAIIELNEIENPDNIPVGLTIEIPQNVVLVDELPPITSTTVAP
ncbi:MAG: LysM domain-containing protein [Actinomycetota bacterium]